MTTHVMTPCRLSDGTTLLVVTDNADAIVSEDIRRNGVWQPAEAALLQALVEPGDRVVDAGAHIGFFTMVLAKRVGPRGQVAAFEPEDDNFALLKANCILNGCSNVALENCALGDRNGPATVFLASGNLGDHRMHPTAGRTMQPSRMIRLDDWNPGQPIDFIKLDTQGSEAAILHGAGATIAASAERLVCFLEISPLLSRASGYGLTDFIAILRRHHASLFRTGLQEIDEAGFAALWQELCCRGADDANESVLLTFSETGKARLRAGYGRVPPALRRH